MNAQNLIVFVATIHTSLLFLFYYYTQMLWQHTTRTQTLKPLKKKDQHIFLLSQTTNTKNVKLYVSISFQQHKKFQIRYPFSCIKSLSTKHGKNQTLQKLHSNAISPLNNFHWCFMTIVLKIWIFICVHANKHASILYSHYIYPIPSLCCLKIITSQYSFFNFVAWFFTTTLFSTLDLDLLLWDLGWHLKKWMMWLVTNTRNLFAFISCLHNKIPDNYFIVWFIGWWIWENNSDDSKKWFWIIH